MAYLFLFQEQNQYTIWLAVSSSQLSFLKMDESLSFIVYN